MILYYVLSSNFPKYVPNAIISKQRFETHIMFYISSCPVDDKLISRFRGSWSESQVFETQVFAYMKTFRFTGSPALYIECDVRMCHGRCPVSWLSLIQHIS